MQEGAFSFKETAFLKGRLFLDQPAFFEVVSFPKEAAPSRKVVLSGETVVLQQRFHDKEQDEYSGGRKDEQEYFFYVYENNVFIGVRFVFGQRLYGRIEVIGEAVSVAISTVTFPT